MDNVYTKGLELLSIRSRAHEIEDELSQLIVRMAADRGYDWKEKDISNIFVRIDSKHNKVVDLVYRQSSIFTFKIKEAELESAYIEESTE